MYNANDTKDEEYARKMRACDRMEAAGLFLAWLGFSIAVLSIGMMVGGG